MRITQYKGPFEVIHQLDRVCFPSDYAVKESGLWWIAWQGGKPVAYAGLKPSHQWSDAGYLCRVGVIPEFRGKGIQKKLLLKRIEMCKDLGYSYVLTDTRRNPASENSLISCGFKLYLPQNPWAFKDSNYWFKDIK